MAGGVSVFLDTSALFAAVYSTQGGAFAILDLGQAEMLQIVVSPQVLTEVESAMRRKASEALAALSLALDRSKLQVVAAPTQMVQASQNLLSYLPDALVLAAAWEANVDYFVTLDKQHFLNNTELKQALPFPVGTPGDFLAWFRAQLIVTEADDA
jgi:predicted nucleic acid-binding protein